MQFKTAAWSPAFIDYRLGLRTPSPQLSFHDLSPSSKLTCKSPSVVVSLPWSTVSSEVISLLLCTEVWKSRSSSTDLACAVLHSFFSQVRKSATGRLEPVDGRLSSATTCRAP